MTSHPTSDPSLRWTMRVIGLLLAAVCTFLFTRDLGQSPQALWLLAAGAGLGLITVLSSWLPVRAPEPDPVRAR